MATYPLTEQERLELEVAAEQGNAAAMYELAFAYFEGAIRPTNVKTTWLSFIRSYRADQLRAARYRIAVDWLYLAAESGDERAQFRLGLFLLEGLAEPGTVFIEEDQIKAREYLAMAANAGHDEARAKLEGKSIWTHLRCNLT